ncbi:MAG TPA: acetoacetate decarboxylase family protein [Jatrophihabitantaceae bacterium]|nr:acetoacetate decarboxylase family protein [Jatrophihabitantaceae bacterium]
MITSDPLTGFLPPYTPSGRSALVAAPPWHYAGRVLSFEFDVDRQLAQSLLPPGARRATGRAAAHFCDWQATTDGSELLDPIYAQYKEFIALVQVDRAETMACYCPFIYVDQDLSLARGWLQGWPKKIGSVWLTRSYGLDHPAAAPIRPGTQLGASVSVKDRRLVDAGLTVTDEPAAEPIGFLAAPTFGLIAAPTLLGTPHPGTPILVRAVVDQRVVGPAAAATGKLEIYDSPRDELNLLRPRRVRRASTCCVALTITGAVAA